MTKRKDDDDVNAKALKWLKDYAVPTGAMLVAFSVAWTKMEYEHEDQRRKIQDVCDQVHSLCDFSSNGFVDPAAHGSHDLHNEHWHREVFGRAGWRKLQQDYATNGGTGSVRKVSQ